MSVLLSTHRAEIARAERRAKRDGDRSAVVDARREYAAAKIEDYITRVLSEAPPLDDDQRAHLATLLTGGAK